MAAISGYATLKTAIDDYTARSLSSYVDYFIQAWEEDFYREPKNLGRWMESSFSSTIASSVIAVPSDYLQMKYAYVNGAPSSRLDRAGLNQLYGKWPRGGATGCPEWFARDTTNFVFGPEPDSDYTIKGVYWAKPTRIRTMTSDAAAHYLIVNAPDLCLFGSLMQAEPFIKNDSRLTIWQSLYDRQVRSYRALQRDEEQSGSPAQEVLG